MKKLLLLVVLVLSAVKVPDGLDLRKSLIKELHAGVLETREEYYERKVSEHAEDTSIFKQSDSYWKPLKDNLGE